MQPPQITDAHKKLDKLVGNWTGTETVQPNPWDQGGEAQARIQNRRVLNGFAVVQDYEQSRGGQTHFRGLGVFRYDAMQNCYVMQWMDSMGFPPNDFKGNFTGDILEVSHQGMHGHSRARFDLSQPGKYTFKMDVSQDGQNWHNFMQGSYTRQGD